jgi:hypothetical protein
MKTPPATEATDGGMFPFGEAAHLLVSTRAPEGHSGEPAIFAFSLWTDKADFLRLDPGRLFMNASQPFCSPVERKWRTAIDEDSTRKPGTAAPSAKAISGGQGARRRNYPEDHNSQGDFHRRTGWLCAAGAEFLACEIISRILFVGFGQRRADQERHAQDLESCSGKMRVFPPRSKR